MKRIILLLLVFTGSFFPSSKLFASHGMGGEVTWTCLPSGQFRFELKFYRDCNGIPAPASVILSTTVPGVPSIPLSLFISNDISPDGLLSNGTTACPTCAQGNGGSPIPGLVEEFIYRSAPIFLSGVPPVGGWVFSWGECCRSSALTNISGGGGLGFQNRAIMYPYLGTNTNPCFDSSPYFAEKPSTIICTGYPFKYNPNAVDPELDSLVYSWGQPLDDAGTVIPFAPGYNVNSQLPSPTQNPLNVAAVINPNTGEITYTSYTGGYFVTVVKVTAYKCGIKVAEIFREINVVMNNSCPPILTGPNAPPTVNAPFFDPVTGLQTSYIDTVYAGDTVNFTLQITDFNLFLNGAPQNITVEGSGSQFGANFTNPNVGCLIPPCATVSPALPFTFAIGGQVTFNWVTTCDHVIGLDTLCTRISNTYNFVIKASDNYCPANATNVGTFSIVVLPPPKLNAPVLRCASVNLDGSVTLNWTKPAVRDSQNTYNSYEIYASLASAGPWILIDSVETPYINPASYSYTHTLASLTALFGTNAQQQSIFYYLKTKSGCFGDSISLPSNILKTIKLDVTLNGFNEAVLNWNALSTPPLSSHATKYRIYKQFPLGTWTLIDSTALLTYIDTTTKQLCSDSVSYRVELSDSTGCISVSSLDGVQVTNPNPVATIIPLVPVICAGGTVTLTCTTIGISYLWSNSDVTASTTVSTAGLYTVTVTMANGCTATGTRNVTVNPLPLPAITGSTSICAGDSVLFSVTPAFASYLWNTSATTQSIYVSTTGTYTVTVTDANGCTNNVTRAFVVNANPLPVITGVNTICQGNTTILNAGIHNTYLWSSGGAITPTITVGTSGVYTVTVTNGAGCSARDTITVVVNPLPNPVITGDNSICSGQTTTFDAGPGFVNYAWSNGIFVQTTTVGFANTFTVTVTDANGCSNTDDITLTINPNPVPVITGTFTTCQGSTTTISGGPGASWLWSTGATTQTIPVGTAGPVTVTVTDINNCVGTDTENITVFALPSASISGIDTICAGQATNFLINFAGPGPYTYTYFDGTANQGPFTTPAISASIVVSPAANSSYTLVNVSNANCPGSVSGTANIAVTPLPTAQISGTSAICIGGNTNLSIDFTGVGPYTYYYTAGASVLGPFTTSNDPEIINVNPLSTTVYGMSATVTGAGCVGNNNPATATVTVNSLPSVAVTGNNTICNGETTDLSLSFIGTAPFTYSYSNGISTFGPFTTSNNPATVTVAPSTTTTYTPVSISDANCSGSVAGAAAITVNPLPTATVSGTAAICNGANTDISILFTGSGPYSYSYNDGTNVFGPYATNVNPVLINVSPLINTTYGITTVSDANCAGSGAGSAAITVIPLPTSDLTGSTEICRGSNTDLLLDFVGVPPFEYEYTDGANTYGPITTNSFSTIINVSPNVTTTYNVTYLTGLGCLGTASGVVDVVVNSIPDADLALTGDDILCAGENSEFILNFTGIAPFNYSYTDGTANFGPFTTSNNPEIIPVTPSSTANYSIVTFSDDKCPGTMAGTALVTVNPLPVATVTGNPAICYGSSTSFNVGFTGTAPYVYSYSDGNTTYGPFTTSSNPEIIAVSPLTSTSYNVLTVSDANCTGSASGVANVIVNQIPTASITGDATICFGQSTNLQIAFTGVGPFTYTYFNGGINIGPLSVANSPATIPVTPGQSTTYTLVSINDANCPGTLSGNADVVVNPLPEPVITGDFEICDGETSTLSATPGFVSYTWTNSQSTSSIVSSISGIYAVTVTDINGCNGTSPAINFIVHQTPVISFTNDTSLTCEIPAVNFINNSSYPSGSNFTWDFGGMGTSQLANPSHIFSTPGNYPVTLTIVTQAGCSDTLTQDIDIMFYPLPVADFIYTPEVTNVFNGKVDFLDQSQNAVSWLWEFGDEDKAAAKNAMHYYDEIGDFRVRLTVINIAGCIDQHEEVVVINPFYVPNAFTPNADGINDYFFDAGYVLDVKSYKMNIFSRWGDKVYEGDDYTKFWNGLDRSGKDLPEGVYVYTIEVITKSGKEHTFQGTVSLIR